MALPKVATPTHTLSLPSDGRKIKYRPFLVKEEKILLMAVESKDEKDIVDAVKKIIGSCVEEDISVDELPVFDIEYLFLNLRSKSVGETVDLKFPCTHCSADCDVNINLSNVDVERTEGHTNNVQITDEIGVTMKYPTFVTTELVDVEKDPLGVINVCIESIYDSKQVYKASESSNEELTEFVESLNQAQFKKIQNFFETMPKLRKNVETVCPKCGKETTLVIERLQDFFA